MHIINLLSLSFSSLFSYVSNSSVLCLHITPDSQYLMVFLLTAPEILKDPLTDRLSDPGMGLALDPLMVLLLALLLDLLLVLLLGHH